MKTCSKCKEEKDYSDFYKNSTRPDGLTYWCKECTKKHVYESVKPGYVSTYDRHKQDHSNRGGMKIGPRLKNEPKEKDDYEYYVPSKETVNKKWEKMMGRLKESGKVTR